MGSGKSFFGDLLSGVLNVSNIDLDHFLEKKENKKIDKIFQEDGEEYFRKKEKEYLLELIDQEKKCIISCGGGTPVFLDNMNNMNANGITIYLKRNPDFLYNYLLKSESNRPIFDNLLNKEKFLKHLEEREFFYLKSKLIVHCEHFSSSKEIIHNIKIQLNDYRFKK